MDDYFRMVVSFFAIIDPIGNMLVFQLITERSTQRERVTVAGVGVLLAFALLTLFALAAGDVLAFLDIGEASFQIAAGVLLVFPALRLVERGDPFATGEGATRIPPMQAAVVPLAIPLLAGPGALATAAAFGMRFGEGATIAAGATILALVFVVFVGSAAIRRYLPDGFVRAAARVIGVLLMAIAIDLIVVGLDATF